MNKLNLNFNKAKIFSRKTSWEKALFWALFLSMIAFIAADSYLLIRPLDSDLEAIVNQEISSSNIIFNNKVLENLKNRQQPQKLDAPQTGKNPFLPF